MPRRINTIKSSTCGDLNWIERNNNKHLRVAGNEDEAVMEEVDEEDEVVKEWHSRGRAALKGTPGVKYYSAATTKDWKVKDIYSN